MMPAGVCSVAVNPPPVARHTTISATPTLLSFNWIASGLIALSPLLLRTVLTLAQLPDQLLEREPRRTRPRHELAHDLIQPPLPLDLVRLHLLMAYERAGPLLRLQHAANLQLPVRPH